MKNIDRKIILILLGGFILPACNKRLNVLPTTSEVSGNLIVDLKSAKTALNGVYYRFADGGADINKVPTTLWNNVFERYPSELSGMLVYPHGAYGFSTHIFTPNDYQSSELWNYGYNLVNAANGFIENIVPVTNIANSTKREMEAEALFLRAFANTQLLLYFGQYYDTTSHYGIILRNKFVKAEAIKLPRSTVQESYNAILSDLDTAIEYLPAQNTQKWFTNRYAAKLLKARLLINSGSNKNYNAVIDICNDIISNGPFKLEPKVKDIFWDKGLNSNEVMLGVQPFPNQSLGYDNFIFQNDNKSIWIQDICTQFMTDLFQGDPRSSWVYASVTDTSDNTREIRFTKYYPGDTTNIKFDIHTELGYAMRLTEAYLLEAEALVESGGSINEAKSLLKTVMQHAGFTDFSEIDNENSRTDLQWLIIKEEVKNFVGEAGQDWFALRRLPFATLQKLLPTINSKDQLILKIPQKEIELNKITQNP